MRKDKEINLHMQIISVKMQEKHRYTYQYGPKNQNFETIILLKIPGNSWKELRELEGVGILRTFAEKR